LLLRAVLRRLLLTAVPPAVQQLIDISAGHTAANRQSVARRPNGRTDGQTDGRTEGRPTDA